MRLARILAGGLFSLLLLLPGPFAAAQQSAAGKPFCDAVGSKSEGWYRNKSDGSGTRELISYFSCAPCEVRCDAIGSKSEGWYGFCAGERSLIAYASCASAARPFPDVPLDHPYAEAIRALREAGIVKGYADGTFHPDSPVNRAEFVKIAIGAFHTPEEIAQCKTVSFKDVPADAWYVHYLCKAVPGLVRGYPDGTFRPERRISFAEASKILSVYYGLVSDESDTIWYRPYVKAMGSAAAIPLSIRAVHQEITRAEMSEMIDRLRSQITTRPSRAAGELP